MGNIQRNRNMKRLLAKEPSFISFGVTVSLFFSVYASLLTLTAAAFSRKYSPGFPTGWKGNTLSSSLPALFLLCLLSAEDIVSYQIKNERLPYLLLAGLPSFILLSHTQQIQSLLSAGIFLSGYFFLGRFLQAGIGGADIKIIAVMLTFSNIVLAVEVIMTAFLSAAFFSLILIVFRAVKEKNTYTINTRRTVKERERRQALKTRLPFVPFLTFGYFIAALLQSGSV